MQLLLDMYIYPANKSMPSYYVKDIANFSLSWADVCEFKFPFFNGIEKQI